jgi:uncharacterized membrane protein
MGFIILAVLIVVIPSDSVNRLHLQGLALLIGSAALAINARLQSAVLNNFSNDASGSSSTLIIDLDQLERLR